MSDISILEVDDQASAAKLENIHNKPNHHIVTLFYRDGCPPCDAMKPEWKKACDQFRQQYKCKNNDVSERTVIANVDDKGIQYLHKVFHKIEGTPTIMYMSNKNNKHVLREFRGKNGKNAKRTSVNFVKWLRSSFGDSVFTTVKNLNPIMNQNLNQNLNQKPNLNPNKIGGCWSWTKKRSQRRDKQTRRRRRFRNEETKSK